MHGRSWSRKSLSVSSQPFKVARNQLLRPFAAPRNGFCGQVRLRIRVASLVKEPRNLIGEDIEIAHRLACGRSVSYDNGRSRGEHLIELLGEFLGEAHFGCEIVW